MTAEQILQHFQDTNALLEGHFLLSSGLHSPKYLFTHWPRMLRHTFRGSTLKSLIGLEDERRAFERYRAIRWQQLALYVGFERDGGAIFFLQ